MLGSAARGATGTGRIFNAISGAADKAIWQTALGAFQADELRKSVEDRTEFPTSWPGLANVCSAIEGYKPGALVERGRELVGRRAGQVGRNVAASQEGASILQHTARILANSSEILASSVRALATPRPSEEELAAADSSSAAAGTGLARFSPFARLSPSAAAATPLSSSAAAATPLSSSAAAQVEPSRSGGLTHKNLLRAGVLNLAGSMRSRAGSAVTSARGVFESKTAKLKREEEARAAEEEARAAAAEARAAAEDTFATYLQAERAASQYKQAHPGAREDNDPELKRLYAEKKRLKRFATQASEESQRLNAGGRYYGWYMYRGGAKGKTRKQKKGNRRSTRKYRK